MDCEKSGKSEFPFAVCSCCMCRTEDLMMSSLTHSLGEGTYLIQQTSTSSNTGDLSKHLHL